MVFWLIQLYQIVLDNEKKRQFFLLIEIEEHNYYQCRENNVKLLCSKLFKLKYTELLNIGVLNALGTDGLNR
jgi:hypothetical protein